MTCKIERVDSGKNAFVLIVSGRIETEHVSGRDKSPVILDLKEVTLVERDVVPFLAACEHEGPTASTISKRGRDESSALSSATKAEGRHSR